MVFSALAGASDSIGAIVGFRAGWGLGNALFIATALFYNMGFFTLLAFTPFPLEMTASQVGWVFFGWGVLLAITSVWTAPALQRRFGTVPVILGALTLASTS